MTSTRAVEIKFPLQGTTANLETSKNINYIQKYSEINTVWAALEITFSSGIYGLRLSQKGTDQHTSLYLSPATVQLTLKLKSYV